MAHPQYHYPPRPYSPPRSTPSPHPGGYPPPSKRQRLSPNPQSPYTSPSISNGSLPNQVFSSPHFGAQSNGYQPRPYIDPSQAAQMAQQPLPHQPPQSAGAMGPPSRPIDKPTDVNDLSDVLVGSGVDLKEEEAALFNRYNSAHNQQQTSVSFTSDHNASFGSTNSPGPQASNFNPYGQFNTLSPNVPGDRGSFYGAGTLNQAAIPQKSAKDQHEEQQKRVKRRRDERRQYHLNDPFLQPAVVQNRLVKRTRDIHVTLPREGLLTSNNQREPVEVVIVGPDRNEVLTVLKGQDLLYSTSPLVEILTLISLATQERLRGVVGDAAALAKSRRVSSHGTVPSELVDLAVGNGAADAASLLTPGNSAVSPMTNPLKRSFPDVNKLPTPVSEGANTPSTLSFSNQTVQALRLSTISDRSFEEERAAKRVKRAAIGMLTVEGGRSGSVSLSTPGPGTPGTIGERAPEIDVKKGSKKDQKRQADAKATEAQQHAATNQTMKMQLGIGRKQPSWMTSAKGASSSSGFPVPSRMNTNLAAQNKGTSGAGTTGIGGLPQYRRQFGDFQEDKETGLGIQMRDVVLVLDPDEKEKKALARAYTKLKR